MLDRVDDNRVQPWKLMNKPSSTGSPSPTTEPINENATWNDEQYAPEYAAPKSYHIVAHIKGNVIIRWVSWTVWLFIVSAHKI